MPFSEAHERFLSVCFEGIKEISERVFYPAACDFRWGTGATEFQDRQLPPDGQIFLGHFF